MKRKGFTLNRSLRRGLNKTLCAALCTAMVASMVPVNVLAAPANTEATIGDIYADFDEYRRVWQHVSTWEQLEHLLTEEQTTESLNIRLEADIKEERFVGEEWSSVKNTYIWCEPSAGKKVLDLNGHSLKLYNGNDTKDGPFVSHEQGFLIKEGVSLTIEDTQKGGVIDCDRDHVTAGEHYATALQQNIDSVPTFDAFRVEKGGKLVVNGGKINVGSSYRQWMDRGECYDCDDIVTLYAYTQIYGSAVQVNGGELVVNGGFLKGRGTDMVTDKVMIDDRHSEFSETSDSDYYEQIVINYPNSQAQNACVQITDSNSKIIINGGHFEARGGAQPIHIGPKVMYYYTGRDITDFTGKVTKEVGHRTEKITPRVFKIYGGDFMSSDITYEILPNYRFADSKDVLANAFWFRYKPVTTRHARLGAFGIPSSALNERTTMVTLGGKEVTELNTIKDMKTKKTLSVRPKAEQPDSGERIHLTYASEEYTSASGASIDYYLGTNAPFYFGKENGSVSEYFSSAEMKAMKEQPNVAMAQQATLYEFDNENVLHAYTMDMNGIQSSMKDEQGNLIPMGNLNGRHLGCKLHEDCGRVALGEVEHTYYLAAQATEKMWAYYDNTEKPVLTETIHSMGVSTDTEDYFKQGIAIHTKALSRIDDVAMSFKEGAVEDHNLLKEGVAFADILEFDALQYEAKLVGVTGPTGDMDLNGNVNEKNADYVLHYAIQANNGHTFNDGFAISGIPGASIPYQMITRTVVDNDTLDVYIQVHSYADNNIYGKATVTSGTYMEVPTFVTYDIHDASGRAISADKLKVTWEVNENKKWTTIPEAGVDFTPGADLVGKSIRVKVTADGYDSACYSDPSVVAAGYTLAGTLAIKATMPANGGFITVKANTTGKFASVEDFNHPNCTYQLQKEVEGVWTDVEDAVMVTKEKEPVINIPSYSGLNKGDKIRVKMTADGYAGELYTSNLYAAKPANYAEVEDMQIESVRNADGSVTFTITNFDSNKEYHTVASLSGNYPDYGNLLKEKTITLAKDQTLYVYCRYKGDDTHSAGEKYVSRCLDATEYLRSIELAMNGELVKGSKADAVPIIWIPVGNSVELNWNHTPADVSKTDFYFYLDSPSGNASLSLSGGVSTENSDKAFRITGNSVGDAYLYATNVSDNPAWHPSYQLKDYGKWIVRVYTPGDINYAELNSKPSYEQARIEVGDSFTPSVNPVTDSNFKLVPSVSGATMSWELAFRKNVYSSFVSLGTDCEYASIDPATGTITCKAPLTDGYMIAKIMAKDTNGNEKEVAQMSLSLCASTKNAIYLDRSEMTLNLDDSNSIVDTLLVGYASPDREGTPDVTFSSSDEKVATVASDGTVTAKKVGEAYITVSYKADSNMNATCKVIVTHNHVYDAGVETVSAGCLENGIMVYTCTKCGDSYEVPIVATGHTWNDATITVKPTCHTLGEAAHTCSVCKDTEKLTVPMTDHNYSLMLLNEKEHAEICLDCGSVKEGTTEEHDFISEMKKAPSESENGLMSISCSVCDYLEEEMIPPVGSNIHTHHLSWVGDEKDHWKECDDEDCTSATLGATKKEAHTFTDVNIDGVVYKQCTVCKFMQDYEYKINLTIKSYATTEETLDVKVYRDNKEGNLISHFTQKGITNWTPEIKAIAGSYYFEVSQEGHVAQSFTIKVGNSDVTKTVQLMRTMPSLKSLTQSTAGVTISWDAVAGVSKYRIYRKEKGATGWTKLADVSGIKYVDRAVEKDKEYIYTLRSLSDDGKTLISDYDKTGKSIKVTTTVYIDNPELTSIKNTTNGITLSWNAVKGAAKYRIYVKGGDATKWTKIADVTGNTYNFTKQADGMELKSGTAYTMTVRCLNADGSYASDFDKTGLTLVYKPVTSVKLATPVLNSATNTTEGVKVTWGAVKGAALYRVYKKDAEGHWKKTVDTNLTGWTDTGAESGTLCTYTVRCLSADGQTLTSSCDTNGKSVLYIAAPVLTSVANADTGIQMKWKASAGAEKYRVYRKNGTEGWKRVADTTEVSYTDTTAVSGVTYFYTVRCVNKDGNNFTSAYDTVGKSIICLAAPKLTKVSNVVEGVKFTWKAVEGAAKYRVYRKTDGGWEKQGDVLNPTFIDTKAVTGTDYKYTVRAVGSDGTTLSKCDTTGLKIYYVAATTLTSAKNVGEGKVKLTWKAVSGVEGYYIYRKTIGDSWGRIATINDPTRVTYTDDGADAGITYMYTIRCFDGAEMSGCDSTGLKANG